MAIPVKVLAPIGVLAGGGLMAAGGIATNASAFSLDGYDDMRRTISTAEDDVHAVSPNAKPDFSASRAGIDRTEQAHRQWLGAGITTAVTATVAVAAGVGALLSRNPGGINARMLAETSLGSAVTAGAAALYGLHQYNRMHDLDSKLAATMKSDDAAAADAMMHTPLPADRLSPPAPTAPLPGPVSRQTLPRPVSVEDETARLQRFDSMLGERQSAVVRAELGSHFRFVGQDQIDNLDLGLAVAALDGDHDGVLSGHERAPILRAEALGFASDVHDAVVHADGSGRAVVRDEAGLYSRLIEQEQEFLEIPTHEIEHGLRMIANHGGPASGMQQVSWNQLAAAADARIDLIT